MHQKLCVATKLQFSKLRFTKSMLTRIRDCSKLKNNDRWGNAMPTWAALPGAHILTDVYPTNDLDMACRDVWKRRYVLQSNTLHWVGESRGEKVKIIFREKFHIMVKISKDFPAASVSFRQIQEKMSTEVLPKRGCWEKSEEKVLGASRFSIEARFWCCITNKW